MRLLTPADLVAATRVSGRAGLLAPIGPARVLDMGRALHHFGPTLAGGFAVAAARFPDRTAAVDEERSVTFRQLHDRSNAQANALRADGIEAGAKVGVLCRNHVGFVEVTAALAKLGADSVLCNTGFGAPQLADVLERERVVAIVHDEDFAPVVRGAVPDLPAYVVWSGGSPSGPTFDDLARRGDPGDPPGPPVEGRTTILTSGTTGIPKGAPRDQRGGVGPGVALLEALPLRVGDVSVIAAPLFHSWGFAHLALGLLLGTTVVLHRRFDPATTLDALAARRAQGLVAVPVMLQRILALPSAVRDAADVGSLRYVAVSGSSLPGPLAQDFMDGFGDVLYNLYGSTEVAYATVASPADLRAAPGTVGRPLRGTKIELRDEHGRPVPTGEQGRIFVANPMLFEGYTDGATKQFSGGFMQTGDVGHVDTEGRLFVDGREDDMIVSGGENVFPEEVEDLLVRHPAVSDAAVVGVPDDDFGQRLVAYVVSSPGVSPTAAELRDYVRDHLARHKTPRDVLIVDELPRNPTGKLLRRRLSEPGGAAPSSGTRH